MSNIAFGTSVEDATRDSLAAAASAGVRVRELSELAELDEVYRLYDSIWRPDPKNPPVTTELLRALTKAGNYVGGAYDGDELLGACVGFFGAPAEVAMHSHVAGVSGAARGRNVGFALKLHQRAWALQRGVTAISWTFDPLVRRNAYFNLVKLAAVPTEYLTNFYGLMEDGINSGDDTDRLLVRWQLDAPEVAAAAARRPRAITLPAATIALGRTADERPSAGRSGDGGTVLVAVPTDVEGLRTTDPAAAKDWRAAVREVLGGLLADGARVTGFDRAGWYVLEHAAKGLV
ncbi:putative GNAT superfamily acetyltransferase [Kribbella voronezhensis]|uniref:Putative GNAT superfamily acetyltransferase n=1 Tax=Kribbella voronezhensis TaxID=2512212 RepID=A0A4V3FIG8_9ACTN|nr:GNAT family N-acetyltransferase [Kribbella voronezhensis]TDU82363.1 putative GNAT superfamily acetyltransferase [Kribbella voronezhensis]